VDKLQRLVEEKIRQAFEEGAFDNLPGKGEPLKLDDDNPFEDPTLRMGHRLLRNNGFTLPWIQEQKEIAQEAERLRTELARSWARAERARYAGHERPQAEVRWRKALTTFRQQVAELNDRIRRYNNEVPLDRFRRLPLDADREIELIAQPLPLAELAPANIGAPAEPPQSSTSRRSQRRARWLRARLRELRAWLASRFLWRVRAAHLATAYN
jgi:DnaJ family protein C protein 28